MPNRQLPSATRQRRGPAGATLHAGYRALLDLLFPVSCIGCGREDAWLCPSCTRRILPTLERCSSCDTPSLHGRTCARCRDRTPLSGLATVGAYRDPLLREAIHALKFEGVRELADTLGDLLAPVIQRALGTTLPMFTIVPLPLHARRERQRSFNQSALIAQRLSERLSLPVVEILERTRATSPQTEIRAGFPDLRRENIAGAFQVREESALSVPTHVVMVDDVSTTGATLEEAARVLYHHGAQDVWGAVICRG